MGAAASSEAGEAEAASKAFDEADAAATEAYDSGSKEIEKNVGDADAFAEAKAEAFKAVNEGTERPDGTAGKMYDLIKEKLTVRNNAINKAVENITGKKGGLGLDPDKPISVQDASNFKDLLEKTKVSGKTPKEWLDLINERISKSTDEAEISRLKRLGNSLEDMINNNIGKIGLIIAGGAFTGAFINALDNKLSGCYVSNASEQMKPKKLNCKNKKLEENCGCPGDNVPAAINKLCPGAVDSSWTCDAGYDYEYKHYTLFGDIIGIAAGAIEFAEDAGGDAAKAFDFFKKYWKIFLIVIVGLLLIPLVMKIIELAKGVEGGTSPPAPTIIPV